ncbi:MAG: hypothetical protein HDQ88_08530 [Clostridia bacterium]|nr:hypothetical protein [Clostridia bacterium]
MLYAKKKTMGGGGIKASDFADHINSLRTKSNISSYPIVVNSAKGATITATQGDVTISSVIDASGTTVLWVPTAGTWNVVASKGSYTSPVTEVEINCDANLVEPYSILTPEIKLREGGYNGAAITLGNKMFIAGGYEGTYTRDSRYLDVVDTDLVIYHEVGNFEKRHSSTAQYVGDKVAFVGGTSISGIGLSNVDVYDENLSRITIITISNNSLQQRDNPNGLGPLGDMVIVAGGKLSVNDAPTNIVENISADLTYSRITSLIQARTSIGTATTSELGYFVGGDKVRYNGGETRSCDQVETYDNELTKNVQNSLEISQFNCYGFTINDIAIFISGYTGDNWLYEVFTYQESTKKIVDPLSFPRVSKNITTIHNKGYILGGNTPGSPDVIDIIETYDENLTHSLFQLDIPPINNRMCTSHESGIILLAGGYNGSTIASNKIDVIRVNI